ncbi:MAG TPA: radical SAM protein [Vicinamibacteria bacterium]|nr:radical SAM protein [Vicinamibacteria bacterium]
MGWIPWSLAAQGVVSYVLRRPWCLSFELTHNCNARCHHCHRGERVVEQKATPQRLLDLCRELRPLVAILSGGEPLLYPDLPALVRLLKEGCAPLRVFLNTNAALLTPARHAELVDAGVDEVLVSLDYPDQRHDDFRAIPGLFGRIQALLAGLPAHERRRVVLTTVLQAENFREALPIARLALAWGVNANFSAYTPLRTNDRSLLIAGDEVAAFGEVVEQLIAFKKQHGNVLTSDWVLRGMVAFFGNGGELGRCRAGERMAVVNPDGTLSPCGLLVRGYATHAELKRGFTATNDCSACFTSTRGNSERPLRHLVLDHVGYLRRRARVEPLAPRV